MACASKEKSDICDHDGFLICKLKRCRLELTVSIDALSMGVEIVDSEEKFWRDRKSKMLLKLKSRSQGLIEQSYGMERTSKFQEREQEWERDEAIKNFDEEVPFGSLMEKKIPYQIEQVEAMETVFCSVSNFCNNGDEQSKIEGLLKQHLINLPIWGSPSELMASLCEG